jgi:hypothetical protein
MTTHTPAELTPEELAALHEVALGTAVQKIPAINLAKLVALRYIAMSERGPIVTGDGLLRLMQSKPGGLEDSR